MELTHLSYSSLSNYIRCGHSYQLTKRYGVQEQPAWWSIGGTAVHSATEELDQKNLLDLEGDDIEAFWLDHLDAAVKEAIEKGWDLENLRASKVRSDKDPFYPNEDKTWWQYKGLDMLLNYRNWRRQSPWRIYDINKVPAVEIGLTPLISTGMPVKMFIDRLFIDNDDNIVVLDLKTGKSTPRTPLQLAFYAWGLSKFPDNPIKVTKGCYYNLRSDKITETFDLTHKKNIVDVMLARFQQAVEQDIYVPNTENCDTCGVKYKCFFGSGTLDDPTISKGEKNG